MEAPNKILQYDNDIFNQWTEKSAYLLGLLEADGHFVWNNVSVGVAYYTSIKDLIFLKNIKATTQHTGRITVKTHRINSKEYQTCGFHIQSRDWMSFLQQHVRTGFIPKTIPSHLIHHYIRGYFDGDGSVYIQNNHPMVNFTFSTKSLADNFLELISNQIGQSNGMKIYQKTNSQHCWYFRIASKQLVIALSKWMYRDATLYLPRKQELLA